MAISLIRCCCVWNTVPKALLSEQHPSRADINENKIMCNKREQQTFSKRWYLNCTAQMSLFGKARFLKWSVHRTTDGKCEKRGKSAPALIPISPSTFLAGVWVGQGYRGCPTVFRPHSWWTSVLVWLQSNSFKGSISPQFSLKREAAVF